MLSFIRLPKGVRKRLDFYRSRFFLRSEDSKHKYRLTKWNIIFRPKDQGGLGIEVLDMKDICLLIKWLFKLLNEEGVCGKNCYIINIYPSKPWLRYILNHHAHLFGKVS
jgi:hypothetical protein